jgi:putative ABC transport system ATP-binding protein
MLKVNKLNRQFKSGDSIVKAVNEVSFEVKEGKFVSIIGRSGSGKSTLLTLLGALDKPNGGSVKVDDRDITKISGKELNEYRAKEIGFIFQGYNLVPNLNAIENVMLAMEFAKSPKKDRKPRAIDLLKQVGLSETEMMRKPGKLSGGQQQRVAIARSLANHPKLILADEPTGNLDSQTGKLIFDLLHSLAKSENTTIVAVTHDLEIAGKADEVYRLDDGKLRKGVK